MAKILIYINSIIIVINSFFGISCMPRGYKLNSEKLASSVAQVTNARIENGTLTGAQVLVKQCGETVLSETYGLDGVGGNELKDDAIYRIASMTKPVTALALLIEYDRGNIDIYADVADYLPEFADMTVQVKDKDGNVIGTEKATKNIKVYQLVSHTSGIGEVDLNDEAFTDYSMESSCKYLSKQPLYFNPGTDQMYSTGAFDVAARIIELSSKMEISEYLKVNIFDKLGMTDTTFEPSEAQWNRFVKVHNMENGKAVNAKTVDGCVFGSFPAEYHAPGAALCSTAKDYSKFAEMLLNGGKAEDGTVVISEETLKLMSTPVEDDNTNGSTRWGLGVTVRVKASATLPVGSFGWSGAYGSHFWVDPVNKITAVYMKNSSYDGGAGNKSATEFEKTLMKSFSLKRVK